VYIHANAYVKNVSRETICIVAQMYSRGQA